jgi:3-phosphoshikimate 1-carboxyvinyltransferase
MTGSAAARPHVSHPVDALSGAARVPGDKSISHRALIFGALATGTTKVTGLLEGEDVLRTAAAMRALGAEAERGGDGSWTVRGRGVGGLSEPADLLDLGNSGTGARLIAGILASHPFTTFVTGDASLRRRPMARVKVPLEQMGARFLTRSGDRLPMAVIGATTPLPIEYRLPVASAQVKSAILLAGLVAPGITTVIEPEATRDHTENLLRHFGGTVKVVPIEADGRAVSVTGEAELVGRDVVVPADPSSAAFLAVAAAARPGSSVTLQGVGINPLRAGLYQTLREMGADLRFENQRIEGGEQVADIVVRGARLRGVEVPASRAPSMIDEYPILAIAAACAEGRTVMAGIQEMRVKESDRIAAVAAGLAANGVAYQETPDSLTVQGSGGRPKGGGKVATQMDHRIAMSFLMLGLLADQPVTVDDVGMIDTSFPGFVGLMNRLGARIEAAA